MNPLVELLRRFTVDVWLAAEAEHAAAPAAPASERLRLVGLYMVFGLSLLAVNYIARGDDVLEWLLPGLAAGPHGALARPLWWAWVGALLSAGPASLYLRFVMGLRLRDLGLSAASLRRHLRGYLLLLAVLMPVVYVASLTEGFQAAYPMAKAVSASPSALLLWELSYVVRFISLEYLFRGAMVLAPARVIGPWAVVASGLPYMVIHIRKPWPEAVGSLVTGMVLGMVALRTRSIWGGVVLHAAAAVSMDLWCLHHKGRLAALLPW